MLTSLFRRLGSSFETIAGPDLQRFTFRLAPLVVLSVSVYWLVPRFSFRDSGSLNVVAQQQVREFVHEVIASVNEANNPRTSSTSGAGKPAPTSAAFRPTCIYCTDYRELTVPLTPLVSVLVKVPVQVYGEGYLGSASSPEYYPMVRADNVVLMFLILVGVVLGLRAVRVPAVRGPFRLTTAPSMPLPSHMTAEEFLEWDVERAEDRARDVYRRSTILLGGGIVMAFVGVALFYVTLPSSSISVQAEPEIARERYYQLLERELYLRRYNPSSREPQYRGEDSLSAPAREEHPWLLFASHSLRPTGMLIFMEGIAWFLLRQYRVLIEEYKSFLRVYLKRSSYLIAWKAAASSGVERQFSVAQAMIGDDLSGTIKKGETTEALEALKMADPPPIIEVLREVKALIPTLNKR